MREKEEVEKIEYEEPEVPEGIEVVEVNGKLMQFDTTYPASLRGIIKVIEIALCFLALILIGSSQPVANERALPFTSASFGIVFAFFLIISYLFTINSKISSTVWFPMEVAGYVLLIIGLFVSFILMAFLCAGHWADVNPNWEVMPALASAALLFSSGIYSIDLIMLLYYWKRWSWHPPADFGPPTQKTTVLPY